MIRLMAMAAGLIQTHHNAANGTGNATMASGALASATRAIARTIEAELDSQACPFSA
jgi:hypothetical protein